MKNQIRNPAEAVSFTNKLSKSSEFYGAFEDPQSSVWAQHDSTFREHLTQLNLLNVNLCYSLLLAAAETLSSELFSQVVKMLLFISFRYNIICNLSPTPLEKVYSDAAIYIRKNIPKSPKPIFEQLSSIYPDDQTFAKCFAEKSLTNSKLARYILIKLNDYYMKNRELVTNPNEKQLNLEHILPQKPTQEWLDSYPANVEIESYIYRLGNMTLLEATVNRRQGNLPFKEKLSLSYSKSTLEITKSLVGNEAWSPKSIEDRQRKMAKDACQIWRLSY